MNEIPVAGYTTSWPPINRAGVILVSFQGRKHAQNVYFYVQSHGRKDERMRHDKKKEIMDCTSFQVTILHGDLKCFLVLQ